jgi:hypothetical protein
MLIDIWTICGILKKSRIKAEEKKIKRNYRGGINNTKEEGWLIIYKLIFILNKKNKNMNMNIAIWTNIIIGIGSW